MALSKDNSALWSDIKTLYNNLNEARTKFSFTTTSVPENQGQNFQPSNVSNLKDLVEEMKTNSYIGSTADTSSVATPAIGEVIRPDSFTQLSTIIDNVGAACVYNSTSFDSTFRGGFDGLRFSRGTNFVSFFSANFSTFDSAFRAAFRSEFRSTFRASFDGRCASQCSGGRFRFTGSFR